MPQPVRSVRHKLGGWPFPSGNRVDIYLEPDIANCERRATCEWNWPPPLSREDAAHYCAVVLPELAKRVQEYLERPCRRALVLFG